MKRKVEIILCVIGVLTYLLLAGVGGIMLLLQDNETFLQEVIREEPELGIGDMDILKEDMGKGGWLFISTSMLAVILGILSIYLTITKPKIAGVILIVSTLLSAVATYGIGIIPGIFYLISAIMCFARKTKTIEYAA